MTDADDAEPGSDAAEPAEPTALRDVLARGEELLADARATIAHLDLAMNNTAVNVIPKFALEGPADGAPPDPD